VNYPGHLSPSVTFRVGIAALHSAYHNTQKVKFSIMLISLERSFHFAPTMSIITRVQCILFHLPYWLLVSTVTQYLNKTRPDVTLLLQMLVINLADVYT